ncbi:MAG: hypothetical protein FJ276_00530 [Planctomycetes bacterium]|nr:hypothetical protein [Planctomycetota bacterium]
MMRQALVIGLALCWMTNIDGSEPNGGAFESLVGQDGCIQLTCEGRPVCRFVAGLHNAQWNAAEATADRERPAVPPDYHVRMAVPGGGSVQGHATITAKAGALNARYIFTPARQVALNSLHVAADFNISVLAGGRWAADGRSGTFPREFGEPGLFHGRTKEVEITLASGQALTFTFPEPTDILLQDDRQWGPSFTLRILCPTPEGRLYQKDVPVNVEFQVSAKGGLPVQHDTPVTLEANEQWIPLRLNLEIAPGSALDFSQMGLQDAPAGKHGWLTARPNGTFAFERSPDTPVRFYGVNFCFSAHYITHAQSDQLADRLVRLGYNTVRLHHHEGELTDAAENRTRLNPEKLDQLDYLVAALIKRGIYVTTDLYVSRPVDIGQLLPGVSMSRRDAMNRFKVLAALNPQAYENWKAFARNLLQHVNPYTGRSYAQEPGVAWLALINEGNLGNFLDLIREIPDYREAWNEWLAARYRDRGELQAAWGEALKEQEDPGRKTVALPDNIRGRDLRARDAVLFLAHVEKGFLERATGFLRKELGVKALVTNMNGWTNHVASQSVRGSMDYVDDHFYVDHPQFLEQPWRLPSRCPNTSPVAGGAGGGRHVTFTRLYDKPFTLSEYNYSGPGRYRGVGGILTGALGAIQDWGVIWRFAYSHSRDNLFQPKPLDYFNMVSDPLSQAGERASICLFLRGDMRPAPHSVAIAMTVDDLRQGAEHIPSLAPDWHWAAWVTRVGTVLTDNPARPLPHDLVLPLGWATAANAFAQPNVVDAGDPYRLTTRKLTDLMRQRGILGNDNRTDPGKDVYECETGEITIDAPQDIMTLDTARTAGGFAPAGSHIKTRNGVEVDVHDTDATVWVSALDDQPIVASARLLVTHLTDLQNSQIRYAERARQTLLDWGGLPHLVRAGRATVRVRLAEPEACQVWALGTDGTRLAIVPATVADRVLTFTADVAGFADHGAVLSYEIARKTGGGNN